MIYHQPNPFPGGSTGCTRRHPCCCCIPVCCCCPMPGQPQPCPQTQPQPCPQTTIRIGTTTTGAPGTPAMVTNSGTQTDAVLNFTIPAGLPGSCCFTPAAPVDDVCAPGELPTQFNLLLANLRAAGLLL